MDLGIRGRKALVCAASKGLGRACAFSLAKEGVDVTIVARTREPLEKTAEEIRAATGVTVTAVATDITTPEGRRLALDACPQPDILVNNAGGQFAAPALDITPNGFRAVVDLNLNGTWLMSKAFAKRMVAAGQSGRIVNIVLSLFSGTPGMVHSGAARAGVINMTKTLAVEWSRYGITVNAVAPGTIDTEGLAQYDRAEIEAGLKRQPIKRMGTAREVALAVAYLVSPAGDFITGTTLILDGGDHLMGAAAEA